MFWRFRTGDLKSLKTATGSVIRRVTFKDIFFTFTRCVVDFSITWLCWGEKGSCDVYRHHVGQGKTDSFQFPPACLPACLPAGLSVCPGCIVSHLPSFSPLRKTQRHGSIIVTRLQPRCTHPPPTTAVYLLISVSLFFFLTFDYFNRKYSTLSLFLIIFIRKWSISHSIQFVPPVK